MKSRNKKAKKILTFYYNHFGLEPPYRVLVCGTFCKQALMDKINIAEQLPKYLCGEVKLLTTKCGLKECELGGSLLYGPFKVLSQYDLLECPHGWFKGGAKCLRKMVTAKGKAKYLVATQDEELASRLREHHVPLLHIAHNCINLEAPSQASKTLAEEQTSQKLGLSRRQVASIAAMKQELGIKEEDSTVKKKKKKGGPNPLSCKPKKKKVAAPGGVSEGKVESAGKKKNRKRVKVRIPKHVKEELFKKDQ